MSLFLIQETQEFLWKLYRSNEITDTGWEKIKYVLHNWHAIAEEHEEELSKIDEYADARAFRDGYETARRDWPRNRFKNPEEITELLLDLAEPQTLTNDEHTIP